MKNDNPQNIELIDALLMLNNKDEAYRFIMDLCTPQEIKTLNERWKVARLLTSGISYRDIHSITGASLTTIGRVARFLKDEPHQGYRIVLSRLKEIK